MKVRFKRHWWGPSRAEFVDPAKRVAIKRGGKLFRKGVRDVPVSLRDQLPSDAEVLDVEVAEASVVTKAVKKSSKDEVLSAVDEDRAAEELYAKVMNKHKGA